MNISVQPNKGNPSFNAKIKLTRGIDAALDYASAIHNMERTDRFLKAIEAIKKDKKHKTFELNAFPMKFNEKMTAEILLDGNKICKVNGTGTNHLIEGEQAMQCVINFVDKYYKSKYIPSVSLRKYEKIQAQLNQAEENVFQDLYKRLLSVGI